jgi:hypothetical protein
VTYYNFVRINNTLRVTLAMSVVVSNRLWEVSDIVALLKAIERKSAKRGPTRSGRLKREGGDECQTITQTIVSWSLVMPQTVVNRRFPYFGHEHYIFGD